MEPPPPPLSPELAAALAPSESAAAYLSRAAADPVATGLFFVPALRPGDALDVVGASGAGKTELLVQVSGRGLSEMERGARLKNQVAPPTDPPFPSLLRLLPTPCSPPPWAAAASASSTSTATLH